MEGGEEGGGGSVWHGEVMGISRADGTYLVASCETRTWEDGYDPFTAPHGTIHVAWTNITVVGGPALSSEGAARWQDYERLRAEETARRGGTAETWLEERRRCAAAERERTKRRQDELARRASMAKAHEAAGKERAARFAATHARLRNEPGPRGVGSRVAHPGGIITTNKAYATAKFFERRGKDAGGGGEGAVGRKRVRWKDEEEEEGEAKRARAALVPTARRVSVPAAAAQAPVPAATAQRREGASSSKSGAAASSETAGAASTPAAKKRQREEDEQTGQTATAAAAAKTQSDTGQTGAATDGDGGAARAAAGAEPVAKKRRTRRGTTKTRNQRDMARRDGAAAAQGYRSQTNTQ